MHIINHDEIIAATKAGTICDIKFSTFQGMQKYEYCYDYWWLNSSSGQREFSSQELREFFIIERDVTNYIDAVEELAKHFQIVYHVCIHSLIERTAVFATEKEAYNFGHKGGLDIPFTVTRHIVGYPRFSK